MTKKELNQKELIRIMATGPDEVSKMFPDIPEGFEDIISNISLNLVSRNTSNTFDNPERKLSNHCLNEVALTLFDDFKENVDDTSTDDNYYLTQEIKNNLTLTRGEEVVISRIIKKYNVSESDIKKALYITKSKPNRFLAVCGILKKTAKGKENNVKYRESNSRFRRIDEKEVVPEKTGTVSN